jgi:hypothetical protein
MFNTQCSMLCSMMMMMMDDDVRVLVLFFIVHAPTNGTACVNMHNMHTT